MPKKAFRIRLGSISFVISGIFFVIYPAVRPFSDERTLQGAAAFASTEWLVAHTLAIIAFTLLPLGLLGFHYSLLNTALNNFSFWALLLALLGVGLVLPFYGGETFGLNALGQEAIKQQSDAFISLASIVRSGTGLIMFLIGLLLLAAAAIILAITIWKSDKYPTFSGIPFVIGMLLYIPQFFGGQPLRITHGALVAIGCVWIAISLWRESRKTPKSKAQAASLDS